MRAPSQHVNGVADSGQPHPVEALVDVSLALEDPLLLFLVKLEHLQAASVAPSRQQQVPVAAMAHVAESFNVGLPWLLDLVLFKNGGSFDLVRHVRIILRLAVKPTSRHVVRANYETLLLTKSHLEVRP